MLEFYKIFLLYIIAVLLSLIILGLSYFIKSKDYTWEKTSSYECGFQPFEDTRSRFDVKFYLVAILFIIFDLEIAYFFPWSLSLDELLIEGIVSMIIFLFILTIGFVYEWKKGALDWD